MEQPASAVHLSRRSILATAAGLGVAALTGGILDAPSAAALNLPNRDWNEDGLPLLAWRDCPDNHISWASYDNGSWSLIQELTDRRTDYAPAMSANLYVPQRFMAWRGAGSDTRIWWSTLTGTSWTDQSSAGAAFNTDAAPAISFYQDTPVMVWRGAGLDNHIWWSTFNGSFWASPQELSDRRTDFGPSVTVDFDGDVSMVWKGAAPDTRIWSSQFNGSSWSDQVPFDSTFATLAAPAITWSYLGPLMAWRSTGSNHIKWSVYGETGYGGRAWTAPQELTDRRTDLTPTLARAVGNYVFMVWKGGYPDTRLWWSIFDGTTSTWSPQQLLGAGFNSYTAPTLSNWY